MGRLFRLISFGFVLLGAALGGCSTNTLVGTTAQAESAVGEPVYVVIMTHVEGDKPEPESSPTCATDLRYQTEPLPPRNAPARGNSFAVDIAGTELLHEILQRYSDSDGGKPQLFIEPTGEFWQTEADPRYGSKLFRKYDYLALGYEFGIQGHGIYYSGKNFCWYNSPKTEDGIRRKLTDLHAFAEKVSHDGKKVNAGLTLTPGAKIEGPTIGRARAEWVYDHVAYALGYRISFEDHDGHLEDEPGGINNSRSAYYLYEADYEDGVRMLKIDFNGSVRADCPGNTARCEKPDEAIARLDRTLAARRSDPDSKRVYYFAFTVHSNGIWGDFQMAQAGLPMRGEGAGLTALMDAIQQRVNSGAKIQFVTPRQLKEIFDRKQTASVSQPATPSVSASSITQSPNHPIFVTFVIHFDPLPAPDGRVLKEGYERERDNLAWLADYLEQLEREKGADYVPKLTLEIAGDHAEYYSEDPVGLALLKRLYAKGHSLGVHFHSNYKAGAHRWIDGRAQDSPEMRRRVTTDHIAAVDALIAKIVASHRRQKEECFKEKSGEAMTCDGTTDAVAIRKANHTITGHLLDEALAREMGFDLLTGGKNEALNLFFDHDVYNPWRPAVGWPLAEDLNNPWLLIPQAPDLGAIGEHAPLPVGVSPEYTQGMRAMIWQDLSIPAMQRKFLHLYLEWQQSEIRNRQSEMAKVWVFGWHEHTNNLFADDGVYGNQRNLRDEVREFVTWLNENFVGSRVARYATAADVAEDFYRWEKAHPGQSSFNYPARTRDWNVYPYQLKGLTRELMYTHYDSEITTFRDQGVRVYKLLKTDGRNWRYEGGRIVSAKATWAIYLLWSAADEKTIDLSALSGTIKLKCTAGRSGVETVQPATSVQVTEEPKVCAATQ